MKIIAVIVTYNRVELLKDSILHLKNQTIPLDEIVIVNNASNDGTKAYLDSLIDINIKIENLSENLGGAGGFQHGIKVAYKHGADYVWIMDDDTMATETALENLLSGIEKIKDRHWGMVASNVLFKDNKPCIMNIPLVSSSWNELLQDGIVRIKVTSFVGLLITREVIDKVGLPIKEFFVWGDDEEYSQRITKQFEGYLIGNSIVKHYMEKNEGVDIFTTSKERISRYFYVYRNHMYMAKKEGFLRVFLYLFSSFVTIIKILLTSPYKWKKIMIIIKGIFRGIIFSPSIEYVNK